MDIREEEVAYRQPVGTLNGQNVVEVGLKGGLHLIFGKASKDAKKYEVLGAGPHRAVARHIAKKRRDDIEWTSINKADYIEPEHFADILPSYEQLTDHLAAATRR